MEINRTLHLLFSRRWWWTTLLVIGGITLTIRLGLWQVSRYHENQALAEHMAAIQNDAPLQISGAADSENLVGMEYRSVQASGKFDYAHQVAIRNQVWEQSWGAEVGYILLTPLVLSDGSAVMVDRGWVPLIYSTTTSWRQFDAPGEATVNGIIRLATKPAYGSGSEPTLAPRQEALDVLNRVDLPILAKQVPYPLLPIYIEQAPDAGSTNLPYRLLPQPEPNDSASTNAGYAATWFAFSLLLIGGYPLYLSRQPKQ